MGVLGNTTHERFCQALHRRLLAGDTRGAARTAAYREVVYAGKNPDDQAIAPNARKLANKKAVKARTQQLADDAAKLAGIDANWALILLRGKAEANLDDYLTPADANGSRFFDLGNVSREKLGRLSELEIEDEAVLGKNADDRRIRKTKVKLCDSVAVVGLMARIAGWLAPTKVATAMRASHDHRIADPSAPSSVDLAALSTADLDELQRVYSETLELVVKVQ
jgi:hypothetical protein